MSNPLEQFINKKSQRAHQYKEIIEDMMVDYTAYHYAERTLLGILDYIEENDDVTDAQIQAINNIRNNPGKPYEHF